MLKVYTNTIIGDYVFDHMVNCNVDENIESLTDTCNITIERKVEWDGKKIALGDDPILKRRDKVIVKAGYDDVLRTIFIGYIKNIKSGVPVKIECEDSMFLLKTAKPVTHSFADAGLKDVLDVFIPAGIKVVTPGDKDIHIGQRRYTNVTAAKMLEDLKTTFGLFSYFRIINDAPVLYVGLPYWTYNRKIVKFEFGYNIIDHDLEYKIADDIRLKIKAISMFDNNNKIEIEVGDADGEIRTVHHYGLSKEQLKVYAEADLERFKYTGYRGTLLAFGEPFTNKGDIVAITGNKYHPDGMYLVKSVKRSAGFNGIRQTIELGGIINDQRNITSAP